MIINIFERDIYQGRKIVSANKEVMVVASEELINQEYKLSPDALDFQNRQRTCAEKLFERVWNDPDFEKKYNCYVSSNGTVVVVLATTEAGTVNILTYLKETMGEMVPSQKRQS